MLWTVLLVIVILWLLGFSFDIAGNFIHILIIIAVIYLIFSLVGRRRG